MFQGHYYQWEAFVPENEPCTFWCRAVEDPNVLKQIQQKASDGTQCSSQGLSVCLDGTCQVSSALLIWPLCITKHKLILILKAVGCDLIVGSDEKVDSCGICGGHNECEATFVWTEVALSHCSAPCGGGYRMARSVCHNNHTKAKVQDDLCNLSQKPASRMAPCNLSPCPAR